jgi:hypothetical protein
MVSNDNLMILNIFFFDDKHFQYLYKLEININDYVIVQTLVESKNVENKNYTNSEKYQCPK